MVRDQTPETAIGSLQVTEPVAYEIPYVIQLTTAVTI